MNFSLFSEGPLYTFYKKIGLANPSQDVVQRRMAALCLFAWLPLLMLTLVDHVSFSAFLNDVDVHVRFLISLALLIYAEGIANEKLQVVTKQFIQSHTIAEKDLKAYHAAVSSAVRWSHSSVVEILLFLFVVSMGRWLSNEVLPFDISAWYGIKKGHDVVLTLPGYWYAFVSLPIFQFILLRWYYRVFLWYRFLWQVSQLRLQLNSLHPDRAGGMGFLINSIYGFAPFLMAQSFLLAGVVLSSILNTENTLWHFRVEIISWVSILIMIPLIPMVFYVVQLVRAKRSGTNEYAIFANRYVAEFRKKWIIEDSSCHEKLLGSSDIQSLADLTNGFNVSEKMRVFPVGKNAILFLIVFTALPFFLLMLTAVPLEKMNKIFIQIIGIVF